MESSTGYSEISFEENGIEAPLERPPQQQDNQRTNADDATDTDAAAGAANAEERRAAKHYDAKAVTAVFPPVILTMLLAVISAKTWMWEPIKKSDEGTLSAKCLGGGDCGGGSEEEADTGEIIKVTLGVFPLRHSM